MSVCTTLSVFHQTAFNPVHQASVKFDGGEVSKIQNSCKLYEKRKHIENSEVIQVIY